MTSSGSSAFVQPAVHLYVHDKSHNTKIQKINKISLKKNSWITNMLVVWMSGAGVAFFYWCPVSGLSMVALVWALNPKAPEWRGVVDNCSK